MPREKGDRRAYWELLRDPQWQRKRLEVMERAEFRCDTCEATDKTLNVHHRLYRKSALPWEYADHELVCLCEDCHEQEHHIREQIDAGLAALGSIFYDDVLGYVHGNLYSSTSANVIPDETPVNVISFEYASGLNDAMRLDLDYTLHPILRNDLTVGYLRKMVRDASQARRELLDEKLRRS